MAVTLATVETLVRYILDETSKNQIPWDIFTYTTTNIFTLTEINPLAIIDVFVNDTSSGISATLDTSTNKVTVTEGAGFTSGDTVEIQYTYYPNYSVTEIQNYVRAAIAHLSVSGYYTFEVGTDDTIYPEPLENEKNLLAFITATLIDPNNQIYRLPDITVQVPNPLNKNDMVRKAIAIFKHDTHGVFRIAGDTGGTPGRIY